MMLVQKCAELYLAVNLLCVFGVDSNQTIIVTPSSSVTRSVQSSLYNSLKSTEVPTVSVPASYKTTLILSYITRRPTTAAPNKKDQKMKGYIIIVIITLTAVALVTLTFMLVFCIFRKRRTQRLERQSSSYNNMNYESTVKFRMDKNGESGALGSTSGDDIFPDSDRKTSPDKKANNNPREYEVVDLPNSRSDQGQRREYENVAPENLNKVDKASSPSRSYENVTPAAKASEDNNKAQPTQSQYEQVVLSSPKTDNQKSKNKQYENVDPPNVSR